MREENEITPQSGWVWLFPDILLYLAVVPVFITGIIQGDKHNNTLLGLGLIFLAALLLIAAILLNKGMTVIQPNEAQVFLLFGDYRGSCKRPGFWWVNPFFTKIKISLRLRTLNGERLKVNDKEGNPIEIASVVVWKVEDTFAACFDVDNYTDFVKTQSESALRHLASAYSYDSWDDTAAVSLRGDIDQVSRALEQELQERLARAGVRIHEARLSHLAYAPEIAEAMLRRQQASAIIAARQKIVEGAVSMVHMALQHLEDDKIVQLDEERRASMISNLLVVLCGETHAQPVINAGTLYH